MLLESDQDIHSNIQTLQEGLGKRKKNKSKLLKDVGKLQLAWCCSLADWCLSIQVLPKCWKNEETMLFTGKRKSKFIASESAIPCLEGEIKEVKKRV